MEIIRTIKMTKAEHEAIKSFLHIVETDEELNSYSQFEIDEDMIAEDNSQRKIFNIEYTDEE